MDGCFKYPCFMAACATQHIPALCKHKVFTTIYSIHSKKHAHVKALARVQQARCMLIDSQYAFTLYTRPQKDSYTAFNPI